MQAWGLNEDKLDRGCVAVKGGNEQGADVIGFLADGSLLRDSAHEAEFLLRTNGGR